MGIGYGANECGTLGGDQNKKAPTTSLGGKRVCMEIGSHVLFRPTLPFDAMRFALGSMFCITLVTVGCEGWVQSERRWMKHRRRSQARRG